MYTLAKCRQNHFQTLLIPVFLSLFLLSTQLKAQRDPVKWPFSKNSIWNMPIGSNAVYEPANFEDAGNVGVDTQHIIITSTSDQEYKVFNSPTFLPGRCSGTTELPFTLPFPRDFVIPDAGNSPFGGTPNSNFALIYPDGDSVFQGSLMSRCEVDGPIYLPDWYQWSANRLPVSIKGNGTDNSIGQGASQMSTLGGTIRLGELTNNQPIRHVIKINPWAHKYLHYSEETPGFIWPAKGADDYAGVATSPIRYNPAANPKILMGSLFAIPKNATPASLNLQTEAGKKLFDALQDYGMYFVEDAAYDTWDLVVQRGEEINFKQKYGFSMESTQWRTEVNKLMKALYIITNNAPSSVGGGGNPGAPLAPDFGIPNSLHNTVISLQTKGKYVSSENGVIPMTCNRTSASLWEQFTIIDENNDGIIALRGYNGKYVSSENGEKAITCNRTFISAWEEFTWIDLGDGKVALRGNNNKHISSENGLQPMTCNRTKIISWETFKYAFISNKGNRIENISAFAMYPNPATSVVKIHNPDQAFTTIRVIDLQGKVVLAQKLSATEETIDIQHLKNGLYLMNVLGKGKTLVKSLVKN